jgi:basic membrane lipoprotein Med (substrate-binding protein (PBP1-ABC) superfamily)
MDPDSILATVRIYWDNMTYLAMKAHREGTWTPGNFLYGINEGGDDICTFDDSTPEGHLDPQTGHEIGPSLSPEIREMIWNLRDQMMAGEITVEHVVEE